MSRPVPQRSHRNVFPTREEKSRVELLLAATDIEAIREVAVLTGHSTLTAVVRDALKAYAWMATENRRRRRVVSEDLDGGNRRELIPLVKVTAMEYGSPA